MRQNPQQSMHNALKRNSAYSRANKRLLLELKDFQDDPLPGIGASPVENNLLLWHANLAGPADTPWSGAILHATLNFPFHYPDEPPTLRLCTRVSHDNVFANGEVCMSILDRRRGDRENSIEYWSPAYTVKTILLQLQSLIFTSNTGELLKNISNPKQYEKAKKEWLSGVKFSVDQSRNYIDKSVGHMPPTKPWPPISDAVPLSKFNPEKDYVCFYTRQNYKQTTLGYGFSFAKNLRTGELSHIKAQIEDFISLKAYMNGGIRSSSLHESFTHFLPIYINPENGEKAMYLAKRAISIVCTGAHDGFKPEQALQILPKLMNTMIVSMMTGTKAYSTRALIGYSHFHRLLIQFILDYPELQSVVDEKVKSFIEDGKARLKDKLPNLGEFLALVSVSSYGWSDIQVAYMNESFTRNVFWLLNTYPQLETSDNGNQLLTLSFVAAETSLKLMLFQKFFLTRMAKPYGAKTTHQQVATLYDQRFAFPTVNIESEFLEFMKSLNTIDNYQKFYVKLELPYDRNNLIQLLRDSIVASAAKGYHGSNSSNILSPEEYSRQSRKFDIEKFASLDEKTGLYILLDDEATWKEMCEQRWGFNELPTYLKDISTPWRKLYLQHNLQDLISNLNDVPDFPHFHKTCDVSKEITHIEVLMFQPNNLKSRYFFLTILLSKLDNLNTLIIKKGSEGLSRNGFKALAKGLSRNMGQLENLILEHCGITEYSISELISGEHQLQFNVKKLSLANNPLGDRGGMNLGLFLRKHENFPELEELDLSGCGIGRNGIKYIAAALVVKKKLKKLTMMYNPCENGLPSVLEYLSLSSSIEEVNISGSGNITTNSTELHSFLEYTPAIKKLNMYKLNFAYVNTISYLGVNQSLTVLDLASSRFQNMRELGVAMANNLTLKKLYLDNNNLTTLSQFMIGFNEELDKQKSVALVRNPNRLIHLEFLSLSKNNFHLQNNDEVVLEEFLSKCKYLKELDLSDCKIGDGTLNLLSKVLRPEYELPLQILKLRGNYLVHQMKEFCASMQLNNSIQILDISGNHLGAKGAAQFAEVVENNRTIQDLNLFGNFIEIEGAESIAAALEKNPVLQKLDLGLNRIRERGCKAILKSIQVNSSLETLLLKHNHLADAIAFQLAKAISQDKCRINKIALAGNFLTPRIRAEVALILSQAPRPIHFDLSNLVRFKDPETLSRTIIISNLKKSDPVQLVLEIKKAFYKAKVGAITNVNILTRKKTTKASTMYAFVEFAHPDSVQLTMTKNRNNEIIIGDIYPKIARSGINETKNSSA